VGKPPWSKRLQTVENNFKQLRDSRSTQHRKDLLYACSTSIRSDEDSRNTTKGLALNHFLKQNLASANRLINDSCGRIMLRWFVQPHEETFRPL